MFITLQFPLFDRRYLLADASRTEKPEWPTPQERERIRYFGQVISRNKDAQKEYKGPWDDEKKYCNARAVIDLCGTGPQHFYKQLHQSSFRSRILFRRFQSNGKCLAKFEIGFNDEFEKKVDAATLNTNNLTDVLCAHIAKYLLCPVKIRVGNKLTNFIPLIDSGKQMTNAYYWATTKGKRSFLSGEIQNKTEPCEPAIFIQVDSERINFTKEWQEIEMPELTRENIKLYHQLIPYSFGHYQFKLKAWIISLPKNIYNNPVHQREFKFYNDTLRYLRINLLRIHVETVIQQKFLSILSRQSEQPITDQQTIIRLYTYLHKVLLNLSGIIRNKQPQQLLVQAAFRLDETYAGAESIDQIIDGLKYYKIWLRTLNLTEETKQVIDYLDKLIGDMEDKKEVASKETTVFVSYNHKDETAAQLLKNKLEENGIKVIIDADAMKAGTRIKDFIKNSVDMAQVTLAIVSANSLRSNWVAMETMDTLNLQEVTKSKQWIACCLDEEFTKDNFVTDAVKVINARLKVINQAIKEHNKLGIDSLDFNDEKSRLIFLKNSLPQIVGTLKGSLHLSIANGQLEKNFPKILEAVLPDAA